MQFLESSFMGLRSARHRLISPDYRTRVTLFPMVHVGEQRFYEAAYAEAGTHDYVLLEGVRSPVARRLTRAYRWIDPATLGLVTQPKPDFSDTTARAIHADLTGPEFEEEWRKVPLSLRVMFPVAATLFGLQLWFSGSRDQIAKGLNTTDLTDRDTILSPAPITRSLLTARDARLCARLEEVIEADAGSVAIIYGAAHMIAVVRFLRAFGAYSAVESDWMTVFDL